ncbi:MAG: hypothetical protein JO041_04635 [Acidobacteria bacterium]|nr:hypothetical protein [Acidobacteriota bacterium]
MAQRQISGTAARTPAALSVHALKTAILPVLLITVLWLLRTNEVSLISVACSGALALFTAGSYYRWREGFDTGSIPLFALVAAIFWMTFSVPLFWGKETFIGINGLRHLPPDAIDKAMVMAVVGVAAMWVGNSLRPIRGPRTPEFIIFQSSPKSHAYLWVVLAVCWMLARWLGTAMTVSGAALTQPIKVLAQFTPAPIFALLLLDYQRGRFTRLDQVGIPIYFIARTGFELATGWLGSTLMLGLVAVLAYVMKWRKFPVVPVAITVLAVLFLQPGKQAFRSRYWATGGGNTGIVEGASFWITQSAVLWKDALMGENSAQWKELGMSSVDRVDIFHQAANVLDYTPRIVPYQNGRLYSFLLVTLVPRFVWPNKPSVNDANRWYQVAYGLTREEDILGVSISCGFLTEAYINFGWVGVCAIMFGLGMFLRYFECVFLSPSSGAYLNALGIALVPTLMTIEAQLSAYVGGIVQMMALTTLALVPVLIWHTTAKRKAFYSPAQVALRKRAAARAMAGTPGWGA